MHTQPTTTPIMPLSAQPFISAAPADSRAVRREAPLLHLDRDPDRNAVETAAINQAERNRQDALEFLHRLIMG